MRANRIFTVGAALVAAGALVAWTSSGRDSNGLVLGAPAYQTLGAMAFGPNNILFIGDGIGGAIHAVQIDDAAKPTASVELAGIDAKIAQALGTTATEIVINDMAVHPTSQRVYLTVTRGRGEGSQSVLLRLTGNAERPIEEVPLTNVKFSTATIANAPASNPTARRNPRTQTVTDIAFADGQVWVAGLSNEEFSSAFRKLSFPFGAAMNTTTVEIYHVSHGANETNAPVMTFVPQQVGGKQYMVAAYTCTPLVAFEAESLKNGQHVVGRTVAELGAGNQPVDMISYTHNGKPALLVANSRHPLMRVDVGTIASAPALKLPSKDVGVQFTALANAGIRQLADLNKDYVVIIVPGTAGLDLKSIAKSSL